MYDLTKQQKLVTDVSCLISDMSRYLSFSTHALNSCKAFTNTNFLHVVVQYILISISDRSAASISQDDRANYEYFESVNEFTLFVTCVLQVKLYIYLPQNV